MKWVIQNATVRSPIGAPEIVRHEVKLALSPFPPPLPPPFPPLPIFHPLSSLPGGPLPLNTARGSRGALKLPQRVWAEPGRQTVSGAF